MTKTYEIRTSNGNGINGAHFSSKAAAFRAARRAGFILGAESYSEHDGTTWYGYTDRASMRRSSKTGAVAEMSITLLDD